MGMVSEFKDFALKGNVVDMAVGIIVGAAFGKIVASLVKDIIMPPIGVLIGGIDFSNYFVTLTGGSFATLAEAEEAEAAVIKYGQVLTIAVDFTVVAFVVFLLIRGMNNLRRKEEEAPPAAPTTRDCPFCVSAIPLQATRCPNCTSALEAAAA